MVIIFLSLSLSTLFSLTTSLSWRVAINGDNLAQISWIFEKSVERATHYGIQGLPTGEFKCTQTHTNSFSHYFTFLTCCHQQGRSSSDILNLKSVERATHYGIQGVTYRWVLMYTLTLSLSLSFFIYSFLRSPSTAMTRLTSLGSSRSRWREPRIMGLRGLPTGEIIC